MRNAVAAIVVIAIIVLGGWAIFGRSNNNTSNSSTTTTSNHPNQSQNSSSAQNQTPASANAVTIQNFAFSPASLTVKKGTTVTWTNKDSTVHTVTADSGSGPNSGQLQPGQSYDFTFNQAGTFAYHCSIHTEMHGTVTVTDTTNSSAPSSNTSTPSSNNPSPY